MRNAKNIVVANKVILGNFPNVRPTAEKPSKCFGLDYFYYFI